MTSAFYGAVLFFSLSDVERYAIEWTEMEKNREEKRNLRIYFNIQILEGKKSFRMIPRVR